MPQMSQESVSLYHSVSQPDAVCSKHWCAMAM